MGLTNLFISSSVFRFNPPNLIFIFSLFDAFFVLLLIDYA
jgi:hypothetical protein